MDLGYALTMVILFVVFLGGFVYMAIASAKSRWIDRDPPFGG